MCRHGHIEEVHADGRSWYVWRLASTNTIAIAGPSLDGKLKLLALEDLGVVDVEKVAVENSLQDAGNDGNPLGLVVGLGGVAVDPVGDVEEAVDAKGEEVVGGDGLGLASALEHEELGEDGDGFEPDGKGPEDLVEGVLLGPDDGKDGGSTEEVVDLEGVGVGVGGGLVGVGHEVDDVALGADEHDFEKEVVEARRAEDVYGGQVRTRGGPAGVSGHTDVSGEVDEQVKGLRLEGDACAALTRLSASRCGRSRRTRGDKR
jgi:hypothetical protein